jgi:hypothetical protein
MAVRKVLSLIQEPLNTPKEHLLPIYDLLAAFINYWAVFKSFF